MKKISSREWELIRNQLNRKPDNLIGISRECPFAKPAVIITLPYKKETGVFPTTFWLSCPYLVEEVSRLEDSGLIGKMTDKLQNDNQFRAEMEEAHQDYARRRMSLLQDKMKETVREEAPGILTVLQESGVGGIQDKEGIKCLHTHLADYLAGGKNPAGKIIRRLIKWPEECSRCENGGLNCE